MIGYSFLIWNPASYSALAPPPAQEISMSRNNPKADLKLAA